MKMHQRAIILLAAIAISTILSFNDSTAYAKTYRLIHMSHAVFTHVDVAWKKGFFKKHGLDLEIVVYSTAKDIMNAIKYKRGDIFCTNLPASLAPLSEENVYLGSMSLWAGGYQVVIRPEIAGKKLKGQKVGILGNAPPGHKALEGYLDKIGIKKSDVRVVGISNEELVENFLTGRLNAVVIQQMFVDTLLKHGGVLVHRSPLMSIGFGGYQSTLPTIPKEDIEKLYRGFYEGKIWAEDPKNQDDVINVWKEITFKDLPAVPREKALMELNNIHRFDAKELLKNNEALNTTKHEGPIYNFLPADKVIQNEAAIKVLKSMLEKKIGTE
jgi:ABC-type nitrate/sulfonate/bicarbonate transport system substrate-binding protein